MVEVADIILHPQNTRARFRVHPPHGQQVLPPRARQRTRALPASSAIVPHDAIDLRDRGSVPPPIAMTQRKPRVDGKNDTEAIHRLPDPGQLRLVGADPLQSRMAMREGFSIDLDDDLIDPVAG